MEKLADDWLPKPKILLRGLVLKGLNRFDEALADVRAAALDPLQLPLPEIGLIVRQPQTLERPQSVH